MDYRLELTNILDEAKRALSELEADSASAVEELLHLEHRLKHAVQLLLPLKAEVQDATVDTTRAQCSDFQDELRRLMSAVKIAKAQTSSTLTFTDLPSDALRSVCVQLPAVDLARLCTVHRAAYECCDQRLLSERAAQCGLETYGKRKCLQQLSLHEALSASLSLLSTQLAPPDYTAQVGFRFGETLLDDRLGSESGVMHSRARIRAVAEAMRRHPSASACIDTHIGAGAPADVAVSHCVNRGAIIAAILVWHHQIAIERLIVRAWGKRLIKHARRSSHPNGDCARSGYGWGELFLRFDGSEMPPRPDYYGHGVGCARELSGASNDGGLAAKVSDAAAILRVAARSGRLGATALPPPRDGDEEEEEEEDDWEDESDEASMGSQESSEEDSSEENGEMDDDGEGMDSENDSENDSDSSS